MENMINDINKYYRKSYNNEDPSYAWMVNAYPNIKLDVPTIASTQENIGTINMPTGTGKTGVVFEDIIRRIENALKNNTNLVIHLCSPRLMLNQQIAQNLIYVIVSMIYTKYQDEFNNKISFYNNSSDTNQCAFKLFRKTNTDVHCIQEIANDDTMIKIVVSCNDSVNNFFKYLKLTNDEAEIVTYFDEAHTLKVTDKKSKNNKELYIDKFCEKSTCVYAISATPDARLTCILNKHSIYRKNQSNKNSFHEYTNPYMIHLSASDAIKNGLIVAPFIDIWKVNTTKITSTLIQEVYTESPKTNPDLKYHKILVTCPCGNNATDKDDPEVEEKKLQALFKQLQKLYKKEIKAGKLRLFATSSTTGRYATVEKNATEIKKFSDVKTFTSEIDNAECDCIILHIRQMIEGIDISSITQVVMYVDNININSNTCANIIQTNGRCMRSASGERKMNMDVRKKKFGICTFVIPETNGDSLTKDIEDFFYRTYLLDEIHIMIHEVEHTGRKSVAGHNHKKQRITKLVTKDNSPLNIDIEEFIKEHEIDITLFNNPDDAIKYIPTFQNIIYKFKNTYMLFDSVNTIEFIKEKIKPLF